MSVDVQNAIVIDRPVSEVSQYAADPDNAPLWYVNIKSVEWVTPPPAQVGSRVAFVAHFLGRRLTYTYELVEFIPGVRLVMRTSEGPFPMETTYTWESNADGTTRMTPRNRGTPSGFSVRCPADGDGNAARKPQRFGAAEETAGRDRRVTRRCRIQPVVIARTLEEAYRRTPRGITGSERPICVRTV